jgi:ethanolamine ammonia-lyase small subunit
MNDLRKDIWGDLRRLTAARIGLPRSGGSLSTAPLLEFQLAHARARDAVHEPLDEKRLLEDLAPLGLPVLATESAATDRQSYLLRPDLGRQLTTRSQALLAQHAGTYDVGVVFIDGLSARAVQKHAVPVLAELLPHLEGLRMAPIVVVRQGRVAAGDAVALALHSETVAVLIGERPGLSAPDSLGAYLTYRPGPQTTDADRNCISNIRPEGLGYAAAAFKIAHLLRAMLSLRLSGVRLKDDSDRLLPPNAS